MSDSGFTSAGVAAKMVTGVDQAGGPKRGGEPTRVWWVVALLVFAACGSERAVPVSDVTVTDSAGVTLVDVGPLPGVPASEWELDRVFTTSRTGVELFRVSAGRILDGGRIVIGDRGASQLLVLDREGKLALRVGRGGDGPGEFRSIVSIHERRDGGFAVYDTRQGRWTRYDGEGELAGTEPMTPPNPVVDLRPLAVDAEGPLLAVYGDMRYFGHDGIQRDTTPLLRYASVDAAPDTLGFWPVVEWAYSATGRGTARTHVGFGRDLASFARGHLAALGDTDSLDVVVFDAGGNARLRVRGGGRRIPVSEAEGERWREINAARLRETAPEALRERFRQAPYRESYPAFDALAVDAEGRLWVGSTAALDADDRLWIVFGAAGSPVGRVTLPADATVLDIAHGHVLLLEIDELDVQTVSLHSLVGTEW